mmetsp:Transcript_111545/g.315828  ORF Transcript_111545/g.315828 Transcript_111545/m.315828 type:complete len:95 (+) Transcript_111545:119-403(+)
MDAPEEAALASSAHPYDVPEVWTVEGGTWCLGGVADPQFELDLLRAERELIEMNAARACRSCIPSDCACSRTGHCCRVPFLAEFQALLARCHRG